MCGSRSSLGRGGGRDRSWGTWLTRVYSEGDRKPLSIREHLLPCREKVIL